jgi:hypothetical protein
MAEGEPGMERRPLESGLPFVYQPPVAVSSPEKLVNAFFAHDPGANAPARREIILRQSRQNRKIHASRQYLPNDT